MPINDTLQAKVITIAQILLCDESDETKRSPSAIADTVRRAALTAKAAPDQHDEAAAVAPDNSADDKGAKAVNYVFVPTIPASTYRGKVRNATSRLIEDACVAQGQSGCRRNSIVLGQR